MHIENFKEDLVASQLLIDAFSVLPPIFVNSRLFCDFAFISVHVRSYTKKNNTSTNDTLDQTFQPTNTFGDPRLLIVSQLSPPRLRFHVYVLRNIWSRTNSVWMRQQHFRLKGGIEVIVNHLSTEQSLTATSPALFQRWRFSKYFYNRWSSSRWSWP